MEFCCALNLRVGEVVPASLGTSLQQQWPWERRKETSFWSSSAVHGPFFRPTFSQHGCLPISFFFFDTLWRLNFPGKLKAAAGPGCLLE